VPGELGQASFLFARAALEKNARLDVAPVMMACRT
jgi:hypothetical protein